MGLLDLETQTKDGTPLPVADYGEAALIPAESMDGAAIWSWATGKEEELDISVRYATGMKKIVVPVDIRFGLFGMGKNRKVQRKKINMKRYGIPGICLILGASWGPPPGEGWEGRKAAGKN